MIKKKLSIFIVTLIIFSLFSNLYAQEADNNEPEQKFKHALGAGAGFTTGYGLSYRYTPNRFGVQLNFAPYREKDRSTYSTGLTFMYTLIESKVTNLFLYQGNHYYYHSYMTYVYNQGSPYMQKAERKTNSYFNNGLGFGIEFIIAKRVGINLMGGYAFYRDFKELNVTGEGGLYYKF